MTVVKRILYILFLGIVTFVVIGASIGFISFALRMPLMLLEAISPIKDMIFLVFLAMVVLLIVGFVMDWAFKRGFSFGKHSLLHQTPALTEDGSLVFVMGEEKTQEGKIYLKVLVPIVHPIPGLLKILPKERVFPLTNDPSEMIKLVMSDGVIKLATFEMKNKD